MTEKYFVEREGIYGRGVFWIGDDKDEAVKKAKNFAKRDKDSYHTWVVKRFIEPNNSTCEPEHEMIFSVTKKGRVPR